jgi:anti-sigma factor RsiW
MSHADLTTLLAYWAGELDEAREAELEQHYLGCEVCSAALAEVEAIAAGVRRAFVAGRVAAVLSPTVAERLQQRGLRIREYRLPVNGSVNCTVAPEDDLLMSRLQVPLKGVTRLDLVLAAPRKDGAWEARLEDVPFDASRDEVVVVPSIELTRAMPAHVQVMRLVAVGEGGERVLGKYTFNHSPHG